MSAPSEEIDIAAARAGMLLAADLKDGAGKVLLPQGATLTEATLNGLRRRGIDTLCVVAAAEAPDPAVLEAERARRRARLARLFRASAGSGATGQLLAYLDTYRSTD